MPHSAPHQTDEPAEGTTTAPRPPNPPLPTTPAGTGLRVVCLGDSFRPEAPTLVALHGVLHDHTAWHAVANGWASTGWNLLGVDLPGHGQSAATPLLDVPTIAQQVMAALTHWPLQRWACVGHSLGSLVALEMAACAPHRVSHLALVGTACPMRVSPALLDAAATHPEQAMALIAQYSFVSPDLAPADGWPDTTPQGQLLAQMRRLHASGGPNVLQRGLQACADYARAEQAMTQVAAAGIPCTIVVGERDRMTPAKAVQRLRDAANRAGGPVRDVTLACGHAHLSEDPAGVQTALRQLLGVPSPS